MTITCIILRVGSFPAKPSGYRPMTPMSSSPRVLLEVIEGPHAGQRLEYDCHDTLVVGRGSAARLQLRDDPHFSRNHPRCGCGQPAR